MRRLAFLLVFLVLAGGAPVSADTPRTLTWDDLIPDGPPIDNPYGDLTPDQQVELEMLASIRQQMAAGAINEVHPMYEDGVELTHKLEQDGIDVDRRVAQVQRMLAQIDERGRQMDPALDGRVVRLPGYALPLEFDGELIKEFLLVPFVGACIHVPPPPINQTVFVTLKEAFIVTELYEPIWVTGRMRVKQVTKALSLVDGTSDVQAGYTIEGVQIAPYKAD